MHSLIINTSSNDSAVSIAENGTIIDHKEFYTALSHNRSNDLINTLMYYIDEKMTLLRSVECIAVIDSGKSFTGARISAAASSAITLSLKSAEKDKKINQIYINIDALKSEKILDQYFYGKDSAAMSTEEIATIAAIYIQYNMNDLSKIGNSIKYKSLYGVDCQ